MAAQFVETETRGDVAWIYLNSFTKAMEAADRETIDVHEAIGWALHNARYDAGVKLIVITGREDGEFYSVPPATHYATPGTLDRINPLKRPGGFAGPSHYPDAIETLAQIEKPVIAKVNGDVIGFGQSVLWGCDIIIAREDAVISDVHLGKVTSSTTRARPGASPWPSRRATEPWRSSRCSSRRPSSRSTCSCRGHGPPRNWRR